MAYAPILGGDGAMVRVRKNHRYASDLRVCAYMRR